MLDGDENKEVKKIKLDADVASKVKEGKVVQNNCTTISIIGSSVCSVGGAIRATVGNDE